MDIVEELAYCPKCGAELTDTQPFHTDTLGDCPTHGRIRVSMHQL